MKNNKRLPTLAAALLFLLPALSGTLHAQIITLTGETFKTLHGKQSGLYSFFTMQDGRLAPVPHQWVQWSEQGYPYFEEDDSTSPVGDPCGSMPRIACCCVLKMAANPLMARLPNRWQQNWPWNKVAKPVTFT